MNSLLQNITTKIAEKQSSIEKLIEKSVILPNLNIIKPDNQYPLKKFPKTTRGKAKAAFKQSENKVTREEDLNALGLSVNRAIDQTFVYQDKVKERMILNLSALKDREDEKKESFVKSIRKQKSNSTVSSVITPNLLRGEQNNDNEGEMRSRVKNLQISIPK